MMACPVQDLRPTHDASWALWHARPSLSRKMAEEAGTDEEGRGGRRRERRASGIEMAEFAFPSSVRPFGALFHGNSEGGERERPTLTNGK